MKRFMIAAVAALSALVATPALAQDNTGNFDGARLGVVLGATGEDFPTDDASATYGAVAGYDVAVSDNFLLGVEADVAFFDNDVQDDRQLSAAVRATVPVGARTALFASAGYSNYRADVGPFELEFDGYRVGGGAELNLAPNLYTTLEYRYTDYDTNGLGELGGHSALVGFGLRF